MRDDRIELLHLTTPGPVGLTALWIAARTRLPLVGSFHTDVARYTATLSGSPRLGYCMGQYLRWLYGRCGHILVPSLTTKDALLVAGMPRERLVIWPRGVDAIQFSPERRSALLRAKWRADTDHPVLLYVGRLSREKGLDLLPPLVVQLHSLGIGCRLVLVGEGPLRRWLTDSCPDAIFMAALGREAVAEAFASADLFLFPSPTDTAGNVVLEAQASGLPVIVSNAGGPRENMLPGATGQVCDGENARQWANAVATLLHDGDERHAMAVAARQYAIGRRWDRALVPLFDTYRVVCPGEHPPSDAVHHAA